MHAIRWCLHFERHTESFFLPAFHTLTDSDFTKPFFNRSKIQPFKKVLRISNSHQLLLSLPSGEPNISEATDFLLMLYIIGHWKKKTTGEWSYNRLLKKKKQTKSKKKKYNLSMDLPPDHSSLKMKISRASFVAHCMSHCLNTNYVPLDPSV